MFSKIIDAIKSRLPKKNSFTRNSAQETSNEMPLNNLGNDFNNNDVKAKQIKLFIMILVGIIIALSVVVHFVQKKVVVREKLEKHENLKIELADKALDGDKMWRNHHEDVLKKTSDELKNRIEKAEELAVQTKDQLIEETKREIETLKEQLKMARAELTGASNSLKEVIDSELERINRVPPHIEPSLEIEDFGDNTELDIPKSAKDYVPEGTYFTGYLMGGIVVSTALSTPDENATPLTIRLKDRGNLAAENETDISKCRVMGSAYGDLSSERAVIRLEKLICKKNGMYTTSSIIGDVHGPDGFNGIKGEIIATSSKHIKNAMIGGVLSGLGNSLKGQSALNITTGGLISSPNKGFKDIAKEGVLSGFSNAGERISDYYLRQAEAMSPVLTIPGGARVNVHITKGFFMGEVGTHRRVALERRRGEIKTRANNKAVKNGNTNHIKEDGSDDNWK